MQVYIVCEDCGCNETCNVACFGTEEEAKSFCDTRNISRPFRFYYEEWKVGEVIEFQPPGTVRQIVRLSVTPMGSDCTQGYVVTGAEGMTVREFIAYICETYKSEHGDFSIRFSDGTLRCDYANGSISAKSIADENFEKTMNLTIDSIKANGGWGMMDYMICCKE